MKKTFMQKIILLFSVVLLQSSFLHAGELETALDTLCEKTKHCADKHASEPDDIEDVMKQVMASQCDGLSEPYDIAKKKSELYAAAIACIQSKTKLSCRSLGAKTSACKKYNRLADKAEHHETEHDGEER